MKQKLLEELEELDSLLKLLKEHDVTEYRFKNDDKSIQLTRGGVVQAVAAAPVAMPVAMAAAAIGYNPEAWDPTPVSAERAKAGCALLAALATTPEEVRRVVLQEECVLPTALTVVGSPEPS